MKKILHPLVLKRSVFCYMTLLTFTFSLSTVYAQTLSFVNAPGSPFTIGGGSLRSNKIIDVNGDGKMDLIFTDYNNSTVNVMLGNGNGSFTQASGSPISVGSGPVYVVPGDFNHDGKWDLAVANYGANSVTILLGNGNGTFTQASGSPITVGFLPYCIDTADFNSDGKQDIAVVNLTSGSANILLGDGNGNFTNAPGSPMSTGSGTGPYHVVTSDFNSDGKPDMAITDGFNDSLLIFLGNGNGSFNPTTNYAVGNFTRTVRCADFNNDGKPDLVVTNLNDNTVYVFLGNTNGTFTPAPGSPMTIGNYPYDVVTTDINHDGNADLTITSSLGNQVFIYYGNGNGSFTNALGSPVSGIIYDAQSVAAADFNNDGKTDLVVNSWATGQVQVLIDTAQMLDGINEAKQAPAFGLFPNPNHGAFTLQSSVVSRQSSVLEIYNMLGEKIYSKQFNIQNSTFNISGSAAGIYMYHVMSEDGKQIATGKLVIE